jgi:hypothetical protein
MTTNNSKNSVQHGLNAAQAKATNSEEQQQVQQLSSQLQSGQAQANTGVAGLSATTTAGAEAEENMEG